MEAPVLTGSWAKLGGLNARFTVVCHPSSTYPFTALTARMLERQPGKWRVGFSEMSYSSPLVTEGNPGPRAGDGMAYRPVVHSWGPPALDPVPKSAAPVWLLSWGNKGMALVDGDLEESRRMTCSNSSCRPSLLQLRRGALGASEVLSSPSPQSAQRREALDS